MRTSPAGRHSRRVSLAAGLCLGWSFALALTLGVGPGPGVPVQAQPPPPPPQPPVAPPPPQVVLFQIQVPALAAPVKVPAPDDLPADVFAPLEKEKMPVIGDLAMPVLLMPGAEVVDLKPLIEQFLPQFRRLAKTEMNFLQRTCSPTNSQRAAIEKERDKIARTAATKYAEFQQTAMQGQWRESQAYPEPRVLLEEAFAPVLKTSLTPEQSARHAAELVRRKEDRKLVAIRNLVARLEDELVLSAEQRQKLIDSLSKNWKDAWVQSLEMCQFNNFDGFPTIPDEHVIPILNKIQILVWQGMTKNDGVFWGAFGGEIMIDEDGDALVVDDDEEEEEDLFDLPAIAGPPIIRPNR